MTKMKKFIALLTALSTLLVCFSLTGCNATVDVTQTVSVKFKGVNGYGTATLDDEYDWIDDVNKEEDELKYLANEIKMREAVQYSLDKADHLSNGDEVTVTIETKEVEGLKMNFKGGELKFVVKGLKEVESFDPFADLKVNFEGFSPNGTMSFTGGDSSLRYTADKDSGLKNGDKITITVTPRSGGSLEDYIESYNKVFDPDTKEFTVDGLAAYVTKVDDIPADMLDKMHKEAEDSMKANAATWMEGNSLKSADPIGYYFLTLKDGVNSSTVNQLYCVYKCTASLTGKIDNKGDEVTVDRVYYTWYSYKNLVIMPDGTCSVDLSKGTRYSGTYKTDIKRNSYTTLYLPGYKDLDSMLNDTVTKVIDKYTYENTVKDTETPAPTDPDTNSSAPADSETESSENTSDTSSSAA